MLRLNGLARGGLVFVPLLVLLACTEDFTTPGSCPETCPGGTVRILDTVVDAVFDEDSSFSGYVQAGDGTGLLITTPSAPDRYLSAMRFGPLPDSVRVGDTLYTFTIDSIAIGLGVLARDPVAIGIALQLYRAPASLDSGVTFAEIDSFITPATFLDSMAVPDTLTDGNLSVVFKGADLAKLEIPPADSGVLAIAVEASAPLPTGVELGNTSAASYLPTVTYYISVPEVDSTKQPSAIRRVPNFATYVEEFPPAPAADQLLLGGAPSSRILVRFSVPDSVLLGVQILRAELILTPSVPIEGVANIPATVTARGVLSDQGAKSPLVPLLAPQTELFVASTDTVTIEVIDIVRTWQALINPPARAFFLSLQPEGSSFTRPLFASTRSATGAPRLRITYVPPLEFEEP